MEAKKKSRKKPDKNCEFCEGTGEVFIPVYDNDIHQWVYADVKDCICITGYPKQEE